MYLARFSRNGKCRTATPGRGCGATTPICKAGENPGRRSTIWAALLCVVAATPVYGNEFPLHSAAAADDNPLIALLISEGADLNGRNAEGDTPLHVAARHGNAKALVHLLVKGAAVDTPNKAGKRAVELGAPPGGLVQRLLQAQAKGLGGIEALLELSIHDAVLHGDTEQTLIRLVKGEDINSREKGRQWSPLHVAALMGDLELTAFFIALGAEPNARGSGGRTPLHFAVQSENSKVPKFLLEHGAQVDARTKGGEWTPLHFAALTGDMDLVQLLLGRGADINAKDNRNWTILHVAAMKDYDTMAQRLLDQGADPSIADIKGFTPYIIALGLGNDRAKEVLAAAGGHMGGLRALDP